MSQQVCLPVWAMGVFALWLISSVAFAYSFAATRRLARLQASHAGSTLEADLYSVGVVVTWALVTVFDLVFSFPAITSHG